MHHTSPGLVVHPALVVVWLQAVEGKKTLTPPLTTMCVSFAAHNHEASRHR
jgi:hypothetical protein